MQNKCFLSAPPSLLEAAEQTMDPAASTFYEPLDADNYEFRVLSILPDEIISPIRCNLRKTSLIDQGTVPTYSALSYCWGDPDIRVPILVNDAHTTVTMNLYTAIWYLRELKIYEIWVDAICINQEDKTERGLQVRFMKRIYEKARGVIAWLGTHSRDSSDALDFLSQSLTPNTSTIEASERQRDALHYFFHLPYWTRVWIIQEIAVGSSVTILCGFQKMDWNSLATVDKISPAFDTIGLRHVNQVRSFRDTYQDCKRVGLIEAMRKSQAAQSTDPRDKIYALLGLTHDGDDLVPFPNYKQHISEVLRDFTKAVMKSKRTLDYLFFGPPGQPEQEDLPTWVVDWVGLHRGKGDFPDIKISPVSNFMLLEPRSPNMLSVRGEILCTIFDTFNLLAMSTTSLPVDGFGSKLVQQYYNMDDKCPSAISNAICSILCLKKAGELDRPLKNSLQSFFSSLWTDNGQLDPETHDQVLQVLMEGPPRINILGLELIESERTFEMQYDSDERYEKDLILWLVRIGCWQIAGKLIEEWLLPGEANTRIGTDILVRILQGIVSRKSDYFIVIKSLIAFYQNCLKLVVTTDGIIGTACARVRPFDKVCLLEGIRENTLVLLRPVRTETDAVVYKVVGGIFLSERESDLQKYPSRIPDQYFDIL